MEDSIEESLHLPQSGYQYVKESEQERRNKKRQKAEDRQKAHEEHCERSPPLFGLPASLTWHLTCPVGGTSRLVHKLVNC